MPKISVVMSSYNHAAFVREAIESVRAQSLQDFELVITDDGSRDGTVDAIRSVNDSRIRLNVFAENQGACVAANEAIGRARGEYVAMLNSDDYFLPGKLERQAAFLDAHPEIAAVFGQPAFVDQRGRPFRNPSHPLVQLFTDENRPRHGWLRHFFYQRNTLCHPTVLIRKACYDHVGLFDPLLMQLPDLDLWVRLCAAHEIHVLPEKLTAFRILDQERNVSAPRAATRARHAWEMSQVLEHYAALPDADLRAIFAPELTEAGATSPRIALALAAIKAGKPGYAPFGLNLLRACLRANPGALSYAEYFRLVGEADPLSAEFFMRDHQWFKRSRLMAAVRRLARWCRSRNFSR